MEQRRLRLGDTLDDYCPRERRVTNHAIVAMIEEDIKQTRCTTCDAEHPYKGARVPRRRKKETPAALFKEVLAGMPDTDATPVLTAPVALAAATETDSDPNDEADEAQDDAPAEPRAAEEPVMHAADADHGAKGPGDDAGEEDPGDRQPGGPEDWPVHRPLIRAQLPRIEGQKEERRPTDFTIRQPGGRTNFRGQGGARFRGHGGGHGQNNGGANGNGNSVRGHSSQRFAGGGRPAGGSRGPAGPGRGPGARPAGGFRGGPPRQGGGKKRSR